MVSYFTYTSWFRSRIWQPDFCLRFEHLAQDFAKAVERIGLPYAELPLRNKSNKADYQQYYDAELQELVARRFAVDIETFGYRFD